MRFWPESQPTVEQQPSPVGVVVDKEEVRTDEFASSDSNRKSALRRLFYVNRNDFKVDTDREDRPIRKVQHLNIATIL